LRSAPAPGRTIQTEGRYPRGGSTCGTCRTAALGFRLPGARVRRGLQVGSLVPPRQEPQAGLRPLPHGGRAPEELIRISIPPVPRLAERRWQEPPLLARARQVLRRQVLRRPAGRPQVRIWSDHPPRGPAPGYLSRGRSPTASGRRRRCEESISKKRS
jgi:hypothetical protein